jgi:hypothetical protein
LRFGGVGLSIQSDGNAVGGSTLVVLIGGYRSALFFLLSLGLFLGHSFDCCWQWSSFGETNLVRFDSISQLYEVAVHLFAFEQKCFLAR